MNFLHKIFNKIGHKIFPMVITPLRWKGAKIYSPSQVGEELNKIFVSKSLSYLLFAVLFFVAAGLIPNILRLTFSVPFSWTVFVCWGIVGALFAAIPLFHFMFWLTYGYTEEQVEFFVQRDAEEEAFRRQEEETLRQLDEMRRNFASVIAGGGRPGMDGGIILDAVSVDEAEDADFSVPSHGIDKSKLH